MKRAKRDGIVPLGRGWITGDAPFGWIAIENPLPFGQHVFPEVSFQYSYEV